MAERDPRLTPARPDLAAAHLQGVLAADRFEEGRAAVVTAPVLDMRGRPDPEAALSTQLLIGEAVTVYEDDPGHGFAWVQARQDGYVGYVPAAGLGPVPAGTPRIITSMGCQTHARPALKSPPTGYLPFLGRVWITEERDGWSRMAQGNWLPSQALAVPADQAGDFVAVAERFLGLPYIWGGRSNRGVDCSALVQLAFQAAGRTVPRDSDMQEQEGEAINTPLARGDLIFWRGHVGIMCSDSDLLHANATHMRVVVEPLAEAEARILPVDGPVTARRRLRADTV